MRNTKRATFQMRRIAELEKQNGDLEAENRAMQKDIDRYAKDIAAKEKMIEWLKTQYADLEEQRAKEIYDILKMKAELRSALLLANSSKAKFENEARILADRFRKGK